MKFSEYQALARRTQRTDIKPGEKLAHAVCGVCSEAGEIAGIYQKTMQGHKVDLNELRKEIGDELWMLAELCDVYGFDMGEVAKENIEKLKKRYPGAGFEEERSVNRAKYEG